MSVWNSDTESLKIMDGEAVVGRIKINRADPNAPVKQTRLLVETMYKSKTSDGGRTEVSDNLKSEMEELLESYYYNAHRLLKMIQALPGLRNVKCREITIVRNKLIEHADHSDIYSFGFGTAGPRIRPFRHSSREWNDDGLSDNTRVFIDALVTAFDGPESA